MNPKSKVQSPLVFAAVIATSAMLHAAPPVIHEPFVQAAGNLNGKTAGTGLAGNWIVGAGTANVLNPDTITHGALANSGGQADAITSGNTNARVSTNTDLATAGLLDNGAALWFSLVFQKTANGGSNEHAGFAFGSSHLTAGASGVALAASGNALGFYVKDGSFRVVNWAGTTNVSSTSGVAGPTVSVSTPAIIVGKIEWGATDSDVEKITLYKPSLDLSSLGTAYALTTVPAFAQTTLNTISFAQRNSGGTFTFDEIRFGAAQADVLPADTVAPTLISITDDKAGGPIGEDVAIITYDLNFDRHMDLASFGADDFQNAGDATTTIGTITQPSPTVIRVQMLPTTTGTVQLRIPASSVIKSLAQVDLNTTAALLDDTIITINAGTTPVNTPTANRWWDGAITSGATNGVSAGGAGTWSTANTNWDRGAGFEGPVAWDNTNTHNAIFSGAETVERIASVSGSINLKDLTFDTTGASGTKYKIDGGTLNFASGAVIRATDNRYDQTITSVITGSPEVRTKDFGANNTYLGLKFAPASGTQILGAVINPDNTGNQDKAGVTFAGATTGNSVASINYSGTDRYADTKLQSGEWSIPGGIRTGTLRISGGTHTIGGLVRCNYNGFLVTGGKVKGAYTIAPENDSPTTFGTGSTIAPGNSIGTVTYTAVSTQKFELQTGSIYEWEVGAANATDTINITKGTLSLLNFTLKVLDAGGTPASGNQLPVFTYSAGVTTPTTATLQANVTIDLSGTSYTGTPSIVNDTVNRVIYVTGISGSSSTYTVTYDGNGSGGGTVPVDGATYSTGATVTVLGNTGSLVKTGFVFTGWNTLADGLGTHYAPAATFSMGSANTTLYADWKTPYNTWADTFLPANVSNPVLDFEGDTLTNLREYAFGTDPTVNFTGPMVYVVGGNVTTPGQPVLLEEGGTYYAVFCRRKDHVAAGLTYTVQFSANLSAANWFNSPTVPTLVTGDPSAGDIEAVRVPFPGLVPTDSGPKKATFYRVQVSLAP